MDEIPDNYTPWLDDYKAKTCICVVCLKEKFDYEIGHRLSTKTELFKALSEIRKRHNYLTLIICKPCRIKLLDSGIDFFDRI